MKAKHLKVKDHGVGNMKDAKMKLKWILTSNTPKTVLDLPFTSGQPGEHIKWRDVPKPCDYWNANYYVGRAHGFSYLDLMFNPEAEEISKDTLGFIVLEIMRQPYGDNEALALGFFSVIHELLLTGMVDR